MNARIDFDAVLEHRHMRELSDAEAYDAALEVAKREVRIELLQQWEKAFAGLPVTIPYATRHANGRAASVEYQGLEEALSDVFGDRTVDALHVALMTAPDSQLVAARTKFRIAAALAYVNGQVEALAEHRILNPREYA